MDSPCYDRATKRHCSDRYPGCSSNCERWDEYVDVRDKVYEKRKRSAEEYSDHMHVKDNVRKYYKNHRKR